ncbi:hypothetical protein [Lysobacter fragariae]
MSASRGRALALLRGEYVTKARGSNPHRIYKTSAAPHISITTSRHTAVRDSPEKV